MTRRSLSPAHARRDSIRKLSRNSIVERWVEVKCKMILLNGDSGRWSRMINNDATIAAGRVVAASEPRNAKTTSAAFYTGVRESRKFLAAGGYLDVRLCSLYRVPRGKAELQRLHEQLRKPRISPRVSPARR